MAIMTRPKTPVQFGFTIPSGLYLKQHQSTVTTKLSTKKSRAQQAYESNYPSNTSKSCLPKAGYFALTRASVENLQPRNENSKTKMLTTRTYPRKSFTYIYLFEVTSILLLAAALSLIPSNGLRSTNFETRTAAATTPNVTSESNAIARTIIRRVRPGLHL